MICDIEQIDTIFVVAILVCFFGELGVGIALAEQALS